MDKWKYHDIACRDHRIIDPISTAKLDEMIEVLKLAPGARVLDIACGKGEMLARLAGRYEILGTGIDLSPHFAAAAAETVSARVHAPSAVDIICADGRDFAAALPFDLAMCIGASWVYGGHAGTLTTLRSFVRPGGLVLTGEPYWRSTPPPAYLAATGETQGNYLTHAGNIAAADGVGLIPLYSIAASEDDWDRYEWLRVQALERYVHAHPDDPDVDALIRQGRLARDNYNKWGREVLGWAIYLYLRP